MSETDRQIAIREDFFSVDGFVSTGFESVAEVFARHFRLGQECNAQCCVFVGGKRVVDLWGTSNEARRKDYDGDSIQLIFSNSKTISSLALATLVDRGLIRYEDRVSKHWPEFAEQNPVDDVVASAGKSKGDVTIRDVLRHESGLPRFQGRFKSSKSLWPENIKRNEIGSVIEKEICCFPPEDAGTDREYHSVTRDFIINEIFRRVDDKRRTIGEFVKEELRGKMGLDLYIGVDDDGLAKTAGLTIWGGLYCLFASALPAFVSRRSVLGLRQMLSRALYYALNPVGFPWPTDADAFNKAKPLYEDETVLRGEIPSVNGMGSARAMAELGAVVVAGGSKDGKTLFGKETYERLHSDPKSARDHGFDVPGLSPTDFTTGGLNYFKGSESYPNEPSQARWARDAKKGFYGWQGFGGSVMQWKPDPVEEYSISFAYAPTLMAWYDPLGQRGASLQEEVVKCVENLKKST